MNEVKKFQLRGRGGEVPHWLKVVLLPKIRRSQNM